MIAYDLQCENGHRFEGWFEDRREFLAQKKRGLIACPVCNSAAVAQIPSRFGIRSSAAERATAPEPDTAQALERLGREISEFVAKNFDDVGCNFAREALKIHYGAAEPRNIRGVSTPAEEKLLTEEGVKFLKLPLPLRPPTDS